MPPDLAAYLDELDDFIEKVIKPLEQQDDNIRFFDHRREDARTDWDRGGLPNDEWEDLLGEARRLADEAGHYRYAVPEGVRRPGRHQPRDGDHPRALRRPRASGLHNDLQNEHSIVGNNVGLLLMLEYGTEEQKQEWVDDLLLGARGFAFGITEPQHGSDATWMETHAERDGDEWVINGEKTWNTGIHKAQYDLIFARTSRQARRRRRHHRVPHADRRTRASRSSSSCGRSTCRPTTPTSASPTSGCRTAAIFGGEGTGLQVTQHFFNENRIRQAASSASAPRSSASTSR